MLGFIIIAVLAIVASGLYLVLRGGAKAANVDLDDPHKSGPSEGETIAAERHHNRLHPDR